jgi:hypothetical protein
MKRRKIHHASAIMPERPIARDLVDGFKDLESELERVLGHIGAAILNIVDDREGDEWLDSVALANEMTRWLLEQHNRLTKRVR